MGLVSVFSCAWVVDIDMLFDANVARRNKKLKVKRNFGGDIVKLQKVACFEDIVDELISLLATPTECAGHLLWSQAIPVRRQHHSLTSGRRLCFYRVRLGVS